MKKCKNCKDNFRVSKKYPLRDICKYCIKKCKNCKNEFVVPKSHPKCELCNYCLKKHNEKQHDKMLDFIGV